MKCPNVGRRLRLLIVSPTPPPPEGEGPHPFDVPDFLALTDAIDVVYCEGAPAQVWDAAGCRRVAPLVTAKVAWAEQQGYDAVLIDCMLDPAVDANKRRFTVPVVGAGEACEAMASLLGSRRASVYPAGIPVHELDVDPGKTYQRVLAAAQRELTRGADVILFACSFLDKHAEALQAETGVPVLPVFRVALSATETVAAFRLSATRSAPVGGRFHWLLQRFSRRLGRLQKILLH